jgi:hypothetical protein
MSGESKTAAFAELSLHYVGEEALLLDPTRQRLYGLNACAALIWGCLKDGESPDAIAQMLNEQFAVPVETAASHVAAVLQQDDSPVRKKKASPLMSAARVTHPRPPRRTESPIIGTYSLVDSIFHVHYGSARLFEEIHPLIQHRATGDEKKAPNANDVDVAGENGGVAVVVGHELIGFCRAFEEAAALVRACLTQLAVMQSGALCALHAGALCRDGRALLLPGDAGYGKSTLSAGLTARGFAMLSDDTALIGGKSRLARSLPAGLCIKRGSCAVLKHHYPQLASLREWRRPDGKLVRYLMPQRDVSWASADAALAVRWIIFPRYGPDQSTALLPLPRHEALARLLRGAFFLSGALDRHNLEELVAWIQQIDCFELPLSSLDRATELIDELCQ